jgi:anti-sigma factor RsiW
MNDRLHPVDELSQYVDGDLPAGRAAEIAAHLAACDACARVAEELRAIAAFARALPARPPERDLWPGIEARLAAPEASPGPEAAVAGGRGAVIRRLRAPAWRRRFSFSLPQLAAAGFALVLLSAAGVWMALRAAAPVPAAGPAAAGTAGSAGDVAGFENAGYEAAVADLQQVLAENRDRLDPETVRTVEQNLAVIDAAIEQARQALVADPASQYLNGHLAQQMQRKLRVLQQAAAFATADYTVAGS